MEYANNVSAERRGSSNSLQMPPQPSPATGPQSAMGPPHVPARSQRYYYSRKGKSYSESQFRNLLEQVKVRAQIGDLPREAFHEVMWMLQQIYPQHRLLKGRTWAPPPGTAPQVLRRLAQEAAGREHQQRQQHMQLRPNAFSPNMVPADMQQGVDSQAVEQQVAAAHRRIDGQYTAQTITSNVIDPRLAAPQAPSQVIDLTSRAPQMQPHIAQSQSNNSRLTNQPFVLSSTSLAGHVRNPNGRAILQPHLPGGIYSPNFVPNLPAQEPSQAPPVGHTEGVPSTLHSSEVRSPSGPSPDTPKHSNRPIPSSLYPISGPLFSPVFSPVVGKFSDSSLVVPRDGTRALLSTLLEAADPTFIRPTIPSWRKTTPAPNAAPGTAPQMGFFAAPVSRPSSRQSKKARVPQRHLQINGNQSNIVQIQQQQQLPAKSDQDNRPIKEVRSRISQSQDGVKTKPTLASMVGQALKVAQWLNLLDSAQAIEKAGQLRGDPAQQHRFIDDVRKAFETEKKSRAQRAASQAASSNAVIDLTASRSSSNKRKEPPATVEQPAAKRQVIDLTEDDELVSQQQTQRQSQPPRKHRGQPEQQVLEDITNVSHINPSLTNVSQTKTSQANASRANVSQQNPVLVGLDDESSKIHPLHGDALTQGVCLVDIAYGHDYHAYPVEGYQCMLDPPEHVQERMRRKNAALKPDVYVPESTIATAYMKVKSGRYDDSYSGNNGGYIAPVDEKAWDNIDESVIRAADGSLRARGMATMTEEGATLEYELRVVGA
jgi:hypothetical protein